MAVKAIVFDIGGVLVDESGVEAREYIAKRHGFSVEDFWDYAKKNLDRSYRGELDAVDFFGGLISELGIEGVSAEELVGEWLEIREKTTRMDEVVKETLDNLKGRYLLGVLSNSTELNERVSVRKDCYGDFDLKILSFEVGFRKPEREIFEVLIERLREKGVEAEETVFVDDREENLLSARELGIGTLLFEDGESMIRDLRGLGVLV